MMPQGSPEWLQARCGKVTASSFSDVISGGKGITRTKYLRRVVAEMLTGKPTETYSNNHMERGNEQEPFARMAYESKTGSLVEEVGFIPHATLMAGCSPDGLVDADGGVEIKSVIPAVQIETILGGTFPSEHRAQIQGCMWITGRQWWDFCSFSPDMPEHLRLYIFRVKRDDEYIKALSIEVMAFITDANSLIEKLKGNT
jgi:YqaJ-like viral recombinase domain